MRRHLFTTRWPWFEGTREGLSQVRRDRAGRALSHWQLRAPIKLVIYIWASLMPRVGRHLDRCSVRLRLGHGRRILGRPRAGFSPLFLDIGCLLGARIVASSHGLALGLIVTLKLRRIL